MRYIKIDEALKLLRSGKELEHNVTHIGVYYFIRDFDNKLVSLYYQTWYALKKRKILYELTEKARDNLNTGDALNMSNYYKLKG